MPASPARPARQPTLPGRLLGGVAAHPWAWPPAVVVAAATGGIWFRGAATVVAGITVVAFAAGFASATVLARRLVWWPARRGNRGGAHLARAYLAAADLRHADLRGADLRDADLRDAEMEGALSDSLVGEGDVGGSDS